MCIHTHTDSKLMRKLTAVMLASFAARPVTLVNYNKEPHDHFTLYASGAEGAQRALDLLNAWHPRYAGNLAAFTDNDFPRLRSRMVPASFPSIELTVALQALRTVSADRDQLRAQLAEYESAPTVAKTLGNDHMHVNRNVARRLLIGTELIQRPQVTK